MSVGSGRRGRKAHEELRGGAMEGDEEDQEDESSQGSSPPEGQHAGAAAGKSVQFNLFSSDAVENFHGECSYSCQGERVVGK